MVTAGKRLDLNFEVRVVRKDGEIETIGFGDLLTGPTVVSVYMRNNTSGCDLQMAGLAKGSASIRELGHGIIAISRDTCGSHRRYAEKMGIDFTLVSDPGFQFAKATDSMVEKSMYGRKYQAPARAAYVLGPDGTVRVVIEKVDTGDHAGQILAALKCLG